MKDGGITVRKAGQMWRLSMKKSTLTQVILNRRVTFDRRIEVPTPFCFLVFIFTRDDVVSQRLKFGSAFLSSSWESKIALFFLTFPYPVPFPKNCVIFIGCNFKSRTSQVGLHKEKRDTASAKKGKVSLQRRGG